MRCLLSRLWQELAARFLVLPLCRPLGHLEKRMHLFAETLPSVALNLDVHVPIVDGPEAAPVVDVDVARGTLIAEGAAAVGLWWSSSSPSYVKLL